MNELEAINKNIVKDMSEKGIPVKPVGTPAVNGDNPPPVVPLVQATPVTIPSATTTTEPPATPPTTQSAATDYSKIPDEELQRILAERNITIPSKVKTPEEIQQEKEARELSVIKFGIEKLGKTKDALLKPSELKNKKDEDLVREQYFEDAKKRNPKILDETIQARYNKDFKINTDGGDEFDDDEQSYGKQKLVDQAKWIRERASKDLNEVTEKWEKQASAEATYNTVSKEVTNYTKANKKFEFEIGGHKIDYTLSDEQIINLNKGLTDSLYVAKTNYAGQAIDLGKQAAFVAREQNLDNIISTLITREKDAAVAEALKPFGNATPFASTSTGTAETIDKKVLDSLNNLPNMNGSANRRVRV